MRLQTYALAALSLGMAVFLLFHFGCIWIYGEFLVTEPSREILAAEMLGAFAVMGFSGYSLVDTLTRDDRKR